ncbi:attractin-like protein 1 [Haliotis cracherodii]|uniref:attractin-like protein 1 n=1 Tax=Haliotis cracherodii TaxID=6455 RepID=UPI0039ED40C9
MADTLVLVCKRERKSKRKMNLCGLLLTILIVQDLLLEYVVCTSPKCPQGGCSEGKCVGGKCECERGWTGERCEKCYGRRSFNGTEGSIYDGEGNYTLDTKCSWLINTNSNNTTIRLKFHQFATECGWDHLYIHDGDSAFSPLLAAYSGLLLTKDKAYTEVDFITRIHQPYIYIHFYSDAAYTMAGFNISYSIGDCPKGCSGNGQCNNEICSCNANWTGSACETAMCPNSCSNNGTCINDICVCDPGFRGEDCGLTNQDGVWSTLQTITPPAGSASHSALVDDKTMWVVGGYSLNDYSYESLKKYDFNSNTWSPAAVVGDAPPPRYGHSTVLYQDQKLFVYGGVVDGIPVSENWMYDITAKSWTNLTASEYRVSGHTAHLHDGKIHVIFGYSPLYGYLNKVQIYDIANDSWSLVDTIGASVRGGYGHTSVYDPGTKKIYVFGGYKSGSQSSYNLTDMLYSYDPELKKWMILKNSGSPRYLHSAVIMNGLMLVFGGNTHNDTSVSYGAKCYSSDFMAYDITCNTWHHLPEPRLKDEISRYGQSMVVKNGSVYMFGGFSGVMRNDLIKFEPGVCDAFTDNISCNSVMSGVRCSWEGGVCVQKSPTSCNTSQAVTMDCEIFTSCPSCLDTANNCSWCDFKCTKACDKTNQTCSNSKNYDCERLSTCNACIENTACRWDNQACHVKTAQQLAEEIGANINSPQCPIPCSERKECSNCTKNNCMWCSNMQQCVETYSYVASFPYGQCTEWTTKDKCPATTCKGLNSCEECQAHPMCGWCNDPSNTGRGRCMEGGRQGPVTNATDHTIDLGQCPREQWFFTDCPKCQCNGHSTCLNESSSCDECKNLTTGSHCEKCQDGFFGNPKNGGECKPCECNGQADSCSPDTGACYCRTKGVTGEKCDSCDDTHKYYGDPKSGTCYYQLVTDYQFTFNLSKPDDKYYTHINFMNIPKASDRDVDFTLNCSGDALLNITFKSKSIPEGRTIVYQRECSYYRSKFEHKDYPFAGEENTTFLVYVYDFKTPFWLQISFSQFPKIDLVHFFVTFFSCFLSLLLIAAALWKIKHKYDSYRRRQQMIVEMQQMASRPFATVTVDVDRKTDPDKKDHKEVTELRKRKRGGSKPAAVALEPLHNTKAAILTVIVQLPTGFEEYAPCGQSGIAMGSTLISYGNTRKQSVEHIRGDRTRLRKHPPTHHPQPDASA